ncbi:MAG: hypothetical protein KBF42_11290 [Chitinophagales bacterium]|jgi:hypothetical protein|nr:hypothetical protein [Chitinophagales bacterium]
MKIVKVTYTTKPEYVLQNKNNILQVMDDLQKLNNVNINYNACLCDDGKTFIHTAFFNTENEQQILNTLPSFINFQEALKAGGLESPPKQELLELVGASQRIFNDKLSIT